MTQGTRQLATALKSALKDSKDSDTKGQLASFVTFLLNQAGETIIINNLYKSFGLPLKIQQQLKYGNDSILHTPFKLSSVTLSKEISYKSIYLDNGAIISAEAASFDKCFELETVGKGQQKFTTIGNINDIKYKARV